MTTGDPLITRMQALVEQWEAATDRRSVFLSCYLRMSRNMLTGIEAGEFHDRIWVAALLRRFAEYYFVALDAYDRGDPATPIVWRYAHDRAGLTQPLVFQHLFLGVNAHINYDLVLALYDLLAPEWSALSAAGRRRRYEDHCQVNEVIARTIDCVQDEVLEARMPVLDAVDRALGPVDEWLTARLLSRWREEAWVRAVEMVEAEAAEAREAIRKRMEADSLRWAERFALGC